MPKLVYFKMAADKEAIAIVLDVGPSMSESPPGTSTPLQQAGTAITMILQRKIFANSKDEIALILFGTPNTANELADGEEYQNITLVRPLGLPDFDLLKYVQNEIQPSNISADFIDAMVVALNHLVKQTEGKKFGGGKRLILFSDLGGEFADDQLDDIVNGMKQAEVQLNVIGPDLDDDDEDEDDRGARPAANGHSKPKSAQQRAGEAMARHLLSQVEGESYSFSEALPALSYFQNRKVKPTPWKCNLEIGNNLQIALAGYVRVVEQKAPNFKNCYAKDIDSEVTTSRSYHLDDEASTEVEKEETAQGHRYGNTLVPFSEDDIANMKLKTVKCFKLLGFTETKNVKRHHFLGNNVQSFVAEKDDEAAGVALSALIRALHETNCVAIVRKVYRANSDAKLGVLSPHIKAGYECLFYNEIPFMEDVRQFTFGSLPLEPDSELNKKFSPSDDQLRAMDNLIDSMDLSKTSQGDEEEEEALKPKLTFNPHLQRLYQCLQHKALNPDDPLPELSPIIADYLKPPQEVLTNCQSHVEKLKEVFPLKVVVKKKEEVSAKSMFQDKPIGDVPASKKPKLDDGALGDMKQLDKVKVTKVGTVTPVEDYWAMLRRKDEDMFEEACKQLETVIIDIIMGSFGAQSYPKAMECMKALREAALKHLEPGVFNKFFTQFKKEMEHYNKMDLFEMAKNSGLRLIDNEECEESTYSKDAVAEFMSDDVKKEKKEEEEMQEEDADDLLDQL
ncbi:X-ray repair cross-complementing protein 5 [Lingula anatina]|uniref:X-ray repair cross-complementing protein 5 n=1 Tax=Lingula anatina TaxID=7574 RepID=A0A2R2MSW1_LINAN|nr:X-ray repair cross-complementing protein 5 [Lingula anatina]|eukprot:XP_023933350.1 X-ray repair cross-complementing protein 5 [Lingula anatina]